MQEAVTDCATAAKVWAMLVLAAWAEAFTRRPVCAAGRKNTLTSLASSAGGWHPWFFHDGHDGRLVWMLVRNRAMYGDATPAVVLTQDDFAGHFRAYETAQASLEQRVRQGRRRRNGCLRRPGHRA